jgi:hypothetical protein
MTSRSKGIIIAALIVLVLRTAAATVYLSGRISTLTNNVSQTGVKKQANLVSPPPQRPLPDQNKFTRTAFIMNRNDNTKPAASVYSDVAQIRGKVRFWLKDSLTVDVAGEIDHQRYSL